MPRRKSPETLQCICLRFIARNVAIWCPTGGEHLGQSLATGKIADSSQNQATRIPDLSQPFSTPPGASIINSLTPVLPRSIACLPGPYTRPVGFSSQPARLPVILPVSYSSPNADRSSPEAHVESDDSANCVQKCQLFEYLSSPVIQQLIDSLITRCQLGMHHLQVLLHPGLTHLTLVHTPYFSNDDDIIDLVKERCQKLTRLTLNLPKCQSREKLIELIRANPNLVFLNLSLTNVCQDSVLKAIGKNCKNIKELLVSSCPVTDTGIGYLTESDSEEPSCPNLVTLDLRRTMVSAVGVKLALARLKKLQNVFHMDVITALCTLHPENAPPNSCVYKLKTLESFIGRPVNNLSVAISYCPLITDINLHECTENETLAPLCSLQHLRKLSLKTSRKCFPLDRMKFKRGVLPVLEAVGDKLENLQLVNFEDIDLYAVIYLCKNLQTLIINIANITLEDPFQDNSGYWEKLKQKSAISPLKFLEHLSLITGMNCAPVPPDCLQYLMGNCHDVATLVLDGIATLDSELLGKILAKNPMPKLKKVEFSNCPSLTANGIMSLLDMENDISKLEVAQCNQMTQGDRESLKLFIDSMHYDVAFSMIVSNWS